jgi:hypothetical protein
VGLHEATMHMKWQCHGGNGRWEWCCNRFEDLIAASPTRFCVAQYFRSFRERQLQQPLRLHTTLTHNVPPHSFSHRNGTQDGFSLPTQGILLVHVSFGSAPAPGPRRAAPPPPPPPARRRGAPPRVKSEDPPPPPHTNLCLSNRLCRFEGANLGGGGGGEGGGGGWPRNTQLPTKFSPSNRHSRFERHNSYGLKPIPPPPPFLVLLTSFLPPFPPSISFLPTCQLYFVLLSMLSSYFILCSS